MKELLRKIPLLLMLALLVSGTLRAGVSRCARTKNDAKQALHMNKAAAPVNDSQERAADICGAGSQYALRENVSIPFPPHFHASRYLNPLDDQLKGEDHSILHLPPPRC